jgi:UDP-N-acetylmuramoyl-L-alanyl-D-glutamate--2,6-diaminopimelate ligase
MSRHPLAALLPDVSGVPAGLEITGLVQDSRALRAGDAFVAIAGFGAHGLKFLDQARAAGAAVVLTEAPLPEEFTAAVESVRAAGLPVIAVDALRARLGALADAFHGAPTAAMDMVGVTGTNGKTSTVQLLAQAWSLRGRRAGTIGTLGAGLHGAVVPTGFTTPLVLQLHALLAQLRADGAEAAAMEVSSHALDQGRVDGVRFDVAVFTNLTRDHLDYHGTMKAYGAAKAKLFDWPGLGAAVINLDDDFGRTLHRDVQARARVRAIGVSARGDADAQLRAEDVVLDLAGIAFTLSVDGARHTVRSPLLGRFYVDNLLAVAGTLYALGDAPARIAETLSALAPVHGRMNRIGGSCAGDGRGADGAALPLAVVDYAHTPDALAQALAALRAHVQGRLICVFGCGGDRDRGKRPQMAAIAEAGADVVFVTDDNPRTEDGDAIVADILAGFADVAAVRVRRDRGIAIAQAIAEAGSGDIVLIAGKGHEPYQEVHGVQYPFDDTAVAQAALDARAAAGDAHAA